jgi:hypothetical protein
LVLVTAANAHGFAAWLAFGLCYSYSLDRTCELAPDEAYRHGSFTQLELRRRGVQLAGTYHRLQVLRERGVRRVLGLVDPRNRLANRTNPKTGYSHLSAASACFRRSVAGCSATWVR